MTRLRRALQGAGAVSPAPIPTRRGWLDRWINDMRAQWLRDRIADGETRVDHLKVQIRLNERDLEAKRVELSTLEK